MGRFFFTTVAALAQLERDQIGERTRLALAHKRSQGQRVSGVVPYGYRLAEDGINLLDEPAERLTVARVRSLRREGLSTRMIGRELLRVGITPRTGTHWHPKVIMDLCRRGSMEMR